MRWGAVGCGGGREGDKGIFGCVRSRAGWRLFRHACFRSSRQAYACKQVSGRAGKQAACMNVFALKPSSMPVTAAAARCQARFNHAVTTPQQGRTHLIGVGRQVKVPEGHTIVCLSQTQQEVVGSALSCRQHGGVPCGVVHVGEAHHSPRLAPVSGREGKAP